MKPRTNVKGTVYLLHFHEKFHHCQHYIGWTEKDDVGERMAKHAEGRGSKLLKAVMEKKITVSLVRVWKGEDRNFERKLKNRKKSKQLCPLCK